MGVLLEREAPTFFYTLKSIKIMEVAIGKTRIDSFYELLSPFFQCLLGEKYGYNSTRLIGWNHKGGTDHGRDFCKHG
ncbi:hypothetical protein SAMN02745123_02637 [Desulforamulus aeronauticus DSM 10349]|uniref:Uncharacterized protein n=1 Tax=Desulforamulus aeronauticus DSM 10349 TaxID=1121421 RepID=A0A1M6U8S4_9FIRM|nr:hypothetical protein SAMN02745123_02637 [Desulforamulus aeronauticus DSM 10349]